MSATETAKARLEARSRSWPARVEQSSGRRRLWVDVPQESFAEVFEHLVKSRVSPILCTITGLDLGADLGFIYHLASDGGIMVNLKIRCPKGQAIRTVTAIFPRRLDLRARAGRPPGRACGRSAPGPPLSAAGRLAHGPASFAEGLEACAKEAQARRRRGRWSRFAVRPKETKPMSDIEQIVRIPIGPQHPALKEPESFMVDLRGEKIDAVRMRFGYNHRGIEKGCEQRSYIQDLYLVERICGICSHSHSTAFIQAVEEIAGLEVPPRALYIRTLVAELERIHSHLLWLGVAGHEIGFDTLLMYTWRDREHGDGSCWRSSPATASTTA